MSLPHPDRFEPFGPEVIDDPYPFYASLRAYAPVYEIAGTGVFLVSTWKLVEEAQTRHEDFSANLTGMLVTGRSGRPELVDLSGLNTFADTIANADEPEHASTARRVPAFVVELRRRELEPGERRAVGLVAAGAATSPRGLRVGPHLATARRGSARDPSSSGSGMTGDCSPASRRAPEGLARRPRADGVPAASPPRWAGVARRARRRDADWVARAVHAGRLPSATPGILVPSAPASSRPRA
jgi:hypothetical protein